MKNPKLRKGKKQISAVPNGATKYSKKNNLLLMNIKYVQMSALSLLS